MTPAYIRSLDGSQGNGRMQALWGQTTPKNANDHEQMARVHPAQPSYFVVVPAPELSSINVAGRTSSRNDRTVWKGARFAKHLNWPTPTSLTTLRLPNSPLLRVRERDR